MHTHTHTWGAIVELDLAKPVISQFIHETVEEGLGAGRVHTELPLGGKIIGLLGGQERRGEKERVRRYL